MLEVHEHRHTAYLIPGGPRTSGDISPSRCSTAWHCGLRSKRQTLTPSIAQTTHTLAPSIAQTTHTLAPSIAQMKNTLAALAKPFLIVNIVNI